MNHSPPPPPANSARAQIHDWLLRQAPDRLLTERFEHFFAGYLVLLRRVAAAHGIAEAEREDVIQEVWIAVQQALPTTGLPVRTGSLRAWLFALVRHKSIDAIRRRQRVYTRGLDELAARQAEPVDADADPARVWERVWADELVQLELAHLRADVGEVNYTLLYQHWAEGVPVKTVAAAVGLTVPEATARLHRLKLKLQTALAVFAGEHFVSEAANESNP